MDHGFREFTDRYGWTLAGEAINRILWLDPDTLSRLAEMDGRVIALQLGEPEAPLFTIYVLPSGSGLQLRAQHDREPDVTICGQAPVFARLLTGARALHPSRDAGLHIRGDIDLGQRFQRVLERLEIDWEEHASRVIGDIAAHRLGRAARNLRGWAEDAGETLLRDGREYLQEELRLLATRERLEQFLRAVDELRADVDRLESRVARVAGLR